MQNTNTYFLTSAVYWQLKRLGYLLMCYECGESIIVGDKVVTYHTRKVREIFHEPCWKKFLERTKGSRQITKSLLRVPPAYQPSPVPHISLKTGVYVRNPHEAVLCPRLSKGDVCKKRPTKWYFYRPKLLLKHHSNSYLQLWMCQGCPDFLLRVVVNG